MVSRLFRLIGVLAFHCLLVWELPSAARAAQLPLRAFETPLASALPLILDESFDEWLHNLTSFWGMKGLSIAVVRRKEDGEWDVETKGFGIKNAAGDAVTENVGDPILRFTSFDEGRKIHRSVSRLVSQSVPIQSSSRLSPLVH